MEEIMIKIQHIQLFILVAIRISIVCLYGNRQYLSVRVSSS